MEFKLKSPTANLTYCVHTYERKKRASRTSVGVKAVNSKRERERESGKYK